MKYLKMLGLAALAAMAVTVVLGATSASAATICTTDSKHATTTACGTHGFHAKANTPFKSTSTNTILTSGLTNVTCDSTIEGTFGNATTGHGLINIMSFSNCHNSNQEPCTAATSGRPWTVTTAYTSGTNGTLNISNFTATFTCPILGGGGTVTCIYSAAIATTAVQGSHTAPSDQATNAKLAKAAGSGFLCASEAAWNGTYNVSTPSSLAVTP